MAGETSHYGFQKLGQGEPFSTNGYKFVDADREQMDRLIWLGAEGHHHTGASAAIEAPDTAPNLALSLTGGTIPAGSQVYYKYTYVDENGNETAASPEATVETPAAVVEPGTVSLATLSTGGSLQPGNYYYVLSAYTNVITQETMARNPNYITVPIGTTTNRITITMPSVPTGADGFNIYRRRPGTASYVYLTSVTSATTTFVDTGATAEDTLRVLPTRNTTNASNAVEITLPGATPTVPEGSTWRVYRTYLSSDYSNSLLQHVTEETFDGSGIISPSTEDVGNATSAGQPPLFSQSAGSPDKINLVTEVQETLPLGLTAFPVTITFSYPGPLDVATGTVPWVCEYPAATIIGCRATLGKGSVPAATTVLVDVNKGTGATPAYTTIYTVQANRPYVPVGLQRGPRQSPSIVSLVVGDSLTVDVDQTGGGATPTDQDLTVNVYMIAHGYPDDTAYVPGTTTGT